MTPGKESIAWEIFDSLDENLRHHLRCADNIVRVMMTDMLLHGIKQSEAVEFLSERVNQLHEINKKIAEGENRRRKGPKSA